MGNLKKIAASILLGLLMAPPVSLHAADDNWRNLSPREKETIRRNYQRWQSLPPQDKERLREQWNRWQNLPQDRRERLRERYNELQREKRRD
ncbi:MAG TPA: DUF3106 domain-containing protein [Candidatus Eisenbacteria bacterium]|nr:DUF3106 domain-containing protein [Candidatus Eisenbacteria bacterium]